MKNIQGKIKLTKKDIEFINVVKNYSKESKTSVESIWRMALNNTNAQSARNVIAGNCSMKLNSAGKIEEWIESQKK